METELMSCVVELPPDFRLQDVLSFHMRDQHMTAERVNGHRLDKGLMWQGHATCLTINFFPLQVEATLAIDGPPRDRSPRLLEDLVRRMLGLTQRIEEFEAVYRHHPLLGPLISRHPGLRIPLSATPFEALSWAITGQQISLNAAISVRRRVIQAAGLQHSNGLYCYPDARRIAARSEEDLRQAGLSGTKARTLLELSRRIIENLLPLDEWMVSLAVDEMREKLLLVNGIGPWTINYALLRGYGWLDGSLHGDVAVRRNLQTLLNHSERITENYAKQWLTEFSPWRALVAAHLWAMKAPQM